MFYFLKSLLLKVLHMTPFPHHPLSPQCFLSIENLFLKQAFHILHIESPLHIYLWALSMDVTHGRPRKLPAAFIRAPSFNSSPSNQPHQGPGCPSFQCPHLRAFPLPVKLPSKCPQSPLSGTFYSVVSWHLKMEPSTAPPEPEEPPSSPPSGWHFQHLWGPHPSTRC